MKFNKTVLSFLISSTSFCLLTPAITTNINSSKIVCSSNTDFNADTTLTPPPLKDDDLMKNYFAPIYPNTAKEFIDSSIDGFKKYFPELIRKTDEGELTSISFKQLFVSDTIATPIAKQANSQIDDPVLEYNAETNKWTNKLSIIDKLDLSYLFTNDTSGNSPEQLLAAVFLNPYLYDDAGVGYESSFINLNRINLNGNGLTSIPENTFYNIIKNSKASANSIKFDLDNNYLSCIASSQFINGSLLADKSTWTFSIDLDNNKLTSQDITNIENEFKNVGSFTIEGNVTTTYHFFTQPDAQNNYFFLNFLQRTYKSSELWPSMLTKTSKDETDNVITKLAAEIDKLNLYNQPLSNNLDKIQISGNDFSGNFEITIKSEKINNLDGIVSNYDDYVEECKLNSIAIPLIIFIVILIAGCCFLYNRIHKIKSKK